MAAPQQMPPSAADVRARSELLAARYPESDQDASARLATIIGDTIPIVESLTCRRLDASLPVDLWPLAARAVALKATRVAHEGSAEVVEEALGSQGLRSFSAGPYSETYFGPGEAATAKVLDPDRATHEALWALASEECRDEWLRSWGVRIPHRPASVLATPAFGRRWL